jgi:hypothetical protein
MTDREYRREVRRRVGLLFIGLSVGAVVAVHSRTAGIVAVIVGALGVLVLPDDGDA